MSSRKRSFWATVARNSPATNNDKSHCNIWLDKLPDDIGIRIAKSLHVKDMWGRYLNNDIINLALVSDGQAHNVLNAMENQLSLRSLKYIKPNVKRSWLSIITPYLRKLSATRIETDAQLSDLNFLVKSPVLESLHTEPFPTVLKSIARKPSLRELRLTWSCGAPQLSDCLPLLFKTLRKLKDLTTLHLFCISFAPEFLQYEDVEDEVYGCDFRYLLDYNPDPAALGRRCPNVHTLSVKCAHPRPWKQLPQFLNGFASLREFTPDFTPLDDLPQEDHSNCKITTGLINKLRTLESVHLRKVDDVYARAVDIGVPVKTVVCERSGNETLSSPAEMLSFSSCPNLEMLDISIKPGVEGALPELAKQLSSLKGLTIEWNAYRERPRRREVVTQYHRPEVQPLLQAVQALPMLVHLALTYVALPVEDFRNTVRGMGDRLESLVVTIRGQDEKPAERLANIMEEVANSNKQLWFFDFHDALEVLEDDRESRRNGTETWGSGLPDDVIERGMRTAFGLLRRNCPLIDWRLLYERVSRYGLEAIPNFDKSLLHEQQPHRNNMFATIEVGGIVCFDGTSDS